MLKLPIMLTTLLFLGACSSGLVTQTVVKQPVIFNPNPPSQVRLGEFKFKILNLKKLKELIKDAEKTNSKITLFALTPNGYEILITNLQELKRYIKQQKEIILYYRRVIKEQTNLINSNNTK